MKKMTIDTPTVMVRVSFLNQRDEECTIVNEKITLLSNYYVVENKEKQRFTISWNPLQKCWAKHHDK